MVRIGISGHRFLAEVEKIEAAVDRALTEIERTFGVATLRIISSLAEGADRLVTRRALDRASTILVVILPLPQEEYIQDFPTQNSQEEFLQLLEQAEEVITLSPVPTREDAYEAAGLYSLNLCDVLLAIWDGQESQGVGGTGGIATEARRRKHPLVWIHAGNRLHGTELPTSLGKEQGLITYEHWAEPST